MDAELMLIIAAAIVALIIVAWLLLKLLGPQSPEARYARTNLAEVRRMNWRDFEHFLGYLFTQLGYQATVTQASGDFGVDVLVTAPDGTKIAVQAKHWRDDDVGVEHVLKTVGGAVHYGCQQSMVITTSGFTAAAREASRTTGCALWGPQELLAAMERAGIQSGARQAAAAAAQGAGARPVGLPVSRHDPPPKLARSVGGTPVPKPAMAGASQTGTTVTQAPAPRADTPRCPRCGVPMMASSALGHPIWICSRWPRCNGALER